jgi:hypothetical protein
VIAVKLSSRLGNAISGFRTWFALLVLEAIAAGAVVVLAKPSSTGARIGWTGILATMLVTSAKGGRDFLQQKRKAEEEAQTAETTTKAAIESGAELWLFLERKLQHLLYVLGKIPSAETTKRREVLRSLESLVVDHASLLPGVSGVRAVIMHYDGERLIPGEYTENWQCPPPTFDTSTGRGKSLIEACQKNMFVWVDDPSKPENKELLEYGPASDEFPSFALVPITSGAEQLGLLEVDAQEINTIVKEDIPLLLVMARILGCGIAIADRQRNRTQKKSFTSTGGQ